MENVNGMAEMLTLMSSFITEYTFTTKSSCVYLNMFTYCQIKAGHHRHSLKLSNYIWTKNSVLEEQCSGTLKQYYTSMEKCVMIAI
jgi:hypothetical protein